VLATGHLAATITKKKMGTSADVPNKPAFIVQLMEKNSASELAHEPAKGPAKA